MRSTKMSNKFGCKKAVWGVVNCSPFHFLATCLGISKRYFDVTKLQWWWWCPSYYPFQHSARVYPMQTRAGNGRGSWVMGHAHCSALMQSDKLAYIPTVVRSNASSSKNRLLQIELRCVFFLRRVTIRWNGVQQHDMLSTRSVWVRSRMALNV